MGIRGRRRDEVEIEHKMKLDRRREHIDGRQERKAKTREEKKDPRLVARATRVSSTWSYLLNHVEVMVMGYEIHQG